VVLFCGSNEARSQYSGSVVEVVADMFLDRFFENEASVSKKKKKKVALADKKIFVASLSRKQSRLLKDTRWFSMTASRAEKRRECEF
jgi:hypothetical protein